MSAEKPKVEEKKKNGKKDKEDDDDLSEEDQALKARAATNASLILSHEKAHLEKPSSLPLT